MPAKDLVFRFLGVDAGAGAEFDRIGGKASKTSGLIGKFALGFVAAGATVAAVSIKMADEFDSADARMRQAFKNSGHSADEYKGRIALVSKQLENLGFTHAQTEIGLGNLTTALRSPAKAFKDIGLAADLARFKHIDLGTAATFVAKAEEGNLRVLKQLGIDLPVTTGGVAKLTAARTALSAAQEHLSQLEDLQHQKAHLTLADHFALENAQKKVADAQKKVNDAASAGKIIHEQLAHILGGQAQAAAGTLAGKEQVLRSKLTDLGVELGHKLIPALTTLVDYTNKHVVPALEGFGGWVSRNKRPIEDIAKVLAAIAAFKFASSKLNDIGKLLGLGGRGVGGVAGELGVQKVFVVNFPPGFGGRGGAVGVAGKDAATVAEEKGAQSVVSRIAEKFGLKTAARTAATLAAPLTDAYLATQGGDQNPAQNGPPLSQRKNVFAQLLATLDAKGRKDFPGADYPGGKLNVRLAVGSLLKTGTTAQIAQLHDLAKTYPQVAAALKGYQSAIDTANDSIGHEKSSLAKLRDEIGRHAGAVANAVANIKKIPGAYALLVAQAKAEGVSIGAALDAGLTIGITQNGGKVNLVSKQLVGGVLHTMHNTAEAQSPSKATIRLGGDLAAGLAVGFTKQMPSVKATIAKSTATALAAINATITNDLQSRKDLAGAVSSGLTGAFDLSNAIGPNGNVLNLGQYLRGGASTLRKEDLLLRKLVGKRLAPGLVAQIAALPPQQAIAVATNLLSGASGSLGSIDKSFAAIGRYATMTGNAVAGAQYDKQLAEAREQTKLLAALLNEAKRNPAAVAGAFDNALKGAQVHHR